MNFLTDKIKSMYFKYLMAAFGCCSNLEYYLQPWTSDGNWWIDIIK